LRLIQVGLNLVEQLVLLDRLPGLEVQELDETADSGADFGFLSGLGATRLFQEWCDLATHRLSHRDVWRWWWYVFIHLAVATRQADNAKKSENTCGPKKLGLVHPVGSMGGAEKRDAVGKTSGE